MRNVGIRNLVLIGSSAALFGYLLHLLDVSAHKTLADIFREVAVIVFFYWLAFGLVTLPNQRRLTERVLGAVDLMAISLVGSLCNTVFRIIRNIYGDWGYISLHQNQFYARHIEPQILFVVEDSFVFFLISVIAAFLIKLTIPTAVEQA